MATINQAVCKECGNIFVYIDGGGFNFHLLRCDTCGHEKGIPFNDIQELHFRYLKGLDMIYCISNDEKAKYARKTVASEPLSEEMYHQLVENKLGKCNCGGKYSFNAELRCNKCRSTKILRGEPEISYG